MVLIYHPEPKGDLCVYFFCYVRLLDKTKYENENENI